MTTALGASYWTNESRMFCPPHHVYQAGHSEASHIGISSEASLEESDRIPLMNMICHGIKTNHQICISNM